MGVYQGKRADLIRIFFLGNDSLTSDRTLREGVKKIFEYKFSGAIFLPPHKPNYSYKATHRHDNLVCLN